MKNYWVENFMVSGHKAFSKDKWRQAILYYLFGVWGDQYAVMHKPEISFGPLTLELDLNDGYYYVYTSEIEDDETAYFSEANLLEPSRKLLCGNSQLEVENGLIRFVKDKHLRIFTIRIGPRSDYTSDEVTLFKSTMPIRTRVIVRWEDKSEFRRLYKS